MTHFNRATPVLRTADYPRARHFYIDLLGYSIVEEGGDPPRFGIFQRDRAVIFVNGWAGGPPMASAPCWAAYFHVGDVDDLLAALVAKAVPITRAPRNTVYGMRELEVTDPDGNVLCFGSDSPPA